MPGRISDLRNGGQDGFGRVGTLRAANLTVLVCKASMRV